MGNKKKLLIPLALIVVLIIIARLHAPVQATVPEGAVSMSGTIEVVDAEVGFKINGRVTERAVDEGEEVKQGQLIARLDASELEQEVSLRNADLSMAKAQLAELEAGSRPEEVKQYEAAVAAAKARLKELKTGSRSQEISAASADLAAARVDAERLRKDAERFESLCKDGAASTQQRDAAVAASNSARERVESLGQKSEMIKEGPRSEQIEQASAALKQVEEKHALVVAGPRQEQIDQAKARVEQAKAALELANVRLNNATLSAPMDGVILSKNIEPGEYVSPGTPIVTVGDIGNVYMRAYVSETDLGKIKLGQSVKIFTDTHPDKTYEGSVTFISPKAEFTPKAVQTTKERVKLVYRVKIVAQNPNQELKPGMPADAIIEM
jgi:HlyD family secretion protein